MANWWNRFKAWLGLSNPGAAREALELWIETHPAVMQKLNADQDDLKEPGGGYRQILRQEQFLVGLPAGSTFHIDVYEEPVAEKSKVTRFGYVLTFTATEADGSVWELKFDPTHGAAPSWIKRNMDGGV